METWVDIKGYEYLYQVSDFGNVKSLSRLKFCGKNAADGTLYKERILKNNIGGHGYLRVNLWKDNKCKMVKVHTLVCLAFIPNPEGKKDINHKNGIKSDNRVSNLEWNTRSENLSHAYRIGLKTPSWKDKFGSDHCRSKQVVQIGKSGNIIQIYVSIREAAKSTGINFSCISAVCNNKNQKTAGGFKWKFKI